MERISKHITHLTIPGFREPFSIVLPPAIAALREKALALHREPRPTIVEITLADARSWAAHTPHEDWLLWRARRCAERLRTMPLDLEPGELLVGKPLFRKPTPIEEQQLQKAQKILATMPPFPGGDTGHFHPDYDTLFREGVGGILEKIASLRTRGRARTFYDACRIAMEGMADYISNTAKACAQMAKKDKSNAATWHKLADICSRLTTHPPTTFHEAIQFMFLIQIALWFGEDHYLTCPGRMDQTLRRFYEADIAAGRITPREAFHLICCLYIQMNRILWPGSAVAVMVGGRDSRGRDVTNDLTYLCLAARLATRLVYPTVGVAWHKGTPSELMDFSLRLLATGLGDPAFFNDEVISRGLREHGVRKSDCHNFMNSTCVEIKVCGCSNIWVATPYINCAAALLEVIKNAKTAPKTFAAFSRRMRENLSTKIREAAQNFDRVWKQRTITGGFPLASCVIKDCLARGRDFDQGGARYNWVENSFVGLANLVDGLVAIKRLVYQEKTLSLPEFCKILENNYAGHEVLRQRIINTLPKYGNDNDEADRLAKKWTEFLITTTESNRVGPHRYVAGFFCWIMHERLGAQTGATPDGRLAGWPLADGAGGAQGRERAGPTASVLSTTKWSHRNVLGGLVHNAKFSKTLLQSERAQRALRHLIETYLKRGGFEIQINVVGKETLLEAQRHPEQYRDLLVRVAGYSDYFVQLGKMLQEEIIARTEHSI